MTDWGFILSIPLIQNMFIATVIACILCGVVGTFVVVNRMVSITGGIAHTTFGGVGFAYFAMSVLLVSWMTPMWGALIFGVAAALILSLTVHMKKVRQDSMIGVLWAVGMAAGVIFMSMMDRTVVTPLSYEAILFGDVLFVGSSTLHVMALISAVILIITALLYREFQILTFDGANANLLGVNVPVMNTILYVIIAVACVMVANIVGIILIIALMTIPAAMANMFIKNLKDTMIFASVISSILAVLGLFVAIAYDTPPGATAVLIIGFAFIAALLFKYVLTRNSAKTSNG
ncbi:MAG: metal ABC transporter permease [Methanomassiliicoccaceae archaeon]|nr:metal ABC transporter permease [Methanomassiliicoccaceae archaeon]